MTCLIKSILFPHINMGLRDLICMLKGLKSDLCDLMECATRYLLDLINHSEQKRTTFEVKTF